MTARLARAAPAESQAWRSPAAWATLIIVLVAGIGADLATKRWAFDNVATRPVVLDRETIITDPTARPIPHHTGRRVLPGDLLELRLELNRGAVFGIAENRQLFFIAFTAAALLGALAIFARGTTRYQRLAHIAVGLILAGGLGNLYDRVAFAAVRDFLRILPGRPLPFGWTWRSGNPDMFPWIFNIADLMLIVGIVALLIVMDRGQKQEARAFAERPSTG